MDWRLLTARTYVSNRAEATQASSVILRSSPHCPRRGLIMRHDKGQSVGADTLCAQDGKIWRREKSNLCGHKGAFRKGYPHRELLLPDALAQLPCSWEPSTEWCHELTSPGPACQMSYEHPCS